MSAQDNLGLAEVRGQSFDVIGTAFVRVVDEVIRCFLLTRLEYEMQSKIIFLAT